MDDPPAPRGAGWARDRPSAVLPDWSRIRRIARWTPYVATGSDLLALSLALAIGGMVDAAGGRELSWLQENIGPVVVVVTWLVAIRVVGGYRAVGEGVHEGQLLVIASAITVAVVVLAWRLVAFPVSASTVAVTLASGTILLLCGREAVGRILRAALALTGLPAAR